MTRARDLINSMSTPCVGHAARHAELHAALDELVACFISTHRDRLPSKTSVMELMLWSGAMMHAEDDAAPQ
ncbi:MAG TPA: hypothetical protein VGO53_16570 [Steroidobacteraceae bacterium]|jgi:hypothetical protein|nr:hypothetical protein [Steroidobacteraceae bacterium]